MIEVEVAFTLNPKDESKLLDGATFVGEEKHVDEYLDTPDVSIMSQDKWLRRRNGRLEIKVPTTKRNSADAATQYRELATDAEVAEAIGLDPAKDLTTQLNENGVGVTYTLKKTRRIYKRGEFTIVLDTMDNGTITAEVELLADDQSAAEAANAKIKDFLQSMKIATPPIQGALLDFLQSERPDLYSKLVKAGVIW